MYYEVPLGAGPEVLQQAANELIAQGVNTVHLAPGAASDDLYEDLAEPEHTLCGHFSSASRLRRLLDRIRAFR